MIHVGTQESEEDENGHYKYGVSAMQGWRTEMVRLLRRAFECKVVFPISFEVLLGT